MTDSAMLNIIQQDRIWESTCCTLFVPQVITEVLESKGQVKVKTSCARCCFLRRHWSPERAPGKPFHFNQSDKKQGPRHFQIRASVRLTQLVLFPLCPYKLIWELPLMESCFIWYNSHHFSFHLPPPLSLDPLCIRVLRWGLWWCG